MKKIKVFLGGTCNESKWREEMIKELEKLDIDYFNPVVEDWTPECQDEEIRQKNEECTHELYFITPKMTGVFSIAEVIDASNKKPEKTFFHYVTKDEDKVFTPGQVRSLNAVGNMVERNGGNFCSLYRFFKILKIEKRNGENK